MKTASQKNEQRKRTEGSPGWVSGKKLREKYQSPLGKWERYEQTAHKMYTSTHKKKCSTLSLMRNILRHRFHVSGWRKIKSWTTHRVARGGEQVPPCTAGGGGATKYHSGGEHDPVHPNYRYTHSTGLNSIPPKSCPTGACICDLVWKWGLCRM